MSEHSVAEARNNLSKLIDRALAGETVVITRHGQPTVRLKPERRSEQRPYLVEESLAYLDRVRIHPSKPQTPAVELIRQLRDEGY